MFVFISWRDDSKLDVTSWVLGLNSSNLAINWGSESPADLVRFTSVFLNSSTVSSWGGAQPTKFSSKSNMYKVFRFNHQSSQFEGLISKKEKEEKNQRKKKSQNQYCSLVQLNCFNLLALIIRYNTYLGKARYASISSLPQRSACYRHPQNRRSLWGLKSKGVWMSDTKKKGGRNQNDESCYSSVLIPS